MKILKIFYAASSLSLIFLQSCSSTTKSDEKIIDQKLTQEMPALKRSQVISDAEQLIEKSANLTDQQRSQLRTLWTNSRREIDELADQSLKLRAVLIDELVAEKFSEDEIALVQKKLSKVEQKRLTVFLNGVYQANHILGRWGSKKERQEFYQSFTINPGVGLF